MDSQGNTWEWALYGAASPPPVALAGPLAALQSAAMRAAFPASYTAGETDDAIAHTTMSEPELIRIGHEDAHLVVASLQAEVAGFLVLTAAGHIPKLYVHPRWQGRGLGRGLVRHAASLATGAGLAQLTVNAALPSVTFYTRCGFTRLQPASLNLPTRAFPVMRMACALSLQA